MGDLGPLKVLGVCGLIGVSTACGGQATGTSGVADGTPRTSADGGAAVIGGGGDDGGVDAGKDTRLTVRSHGLGNVQVRDEKKGVDCGPTPADDGTERCLPLGASGRVLFTDPECTVPVIFPTFPDPCGGGDPAYFTHYGGPTGCAVPNTATFTAGSPIETPPALYNQGLGGCFVVKDADRSSFRLVDGTFYDAVLVPATDWVKLTKKTVPVTDALGVTSWKGADGSAIPEGFELLPSGTPCAPYPPDAGPDAEKHCVPTLRAVVSDVYADESCEGARLTTSCTPTEVVELGSGIDSGATIGGLFEAVSAGSTAHFVDPFAHDACESFPASPNDASYLYTAGSPLAVNRYPLVALTIEGTGRLQTEYWTSDGKNLLAESLYDSSSGKTCTPTQLSDGGTWCVPDSALTFAYYGDAGCTVPVGVGPSDLSTPQWGLLYPQDRACTPTPPGLRAVVRSPSSSYYFMEYPDGAPEQCDRFDGVPSNLQLFAPGMPLDPSTVFAAAPSDP